MQVFRAVLPPEAAGRWCCVWLGMDAPGRWWAKLEATDKARGQVVREVFLGKTASSSFLKKRSKKLLHPALNQVALISIRDVIPRIKSFLVRAGRAPPFFKKELLSSFTRPGLLHLPQAAECLHVYVFSEGATAPGEPHLHLRVLGRLEAALRLLWLGWYRLPLASAGSMKGLAGRIRAILGQNPARLGEAPPYALWLDLFDQWGEAEFSALSAGLSGLIEIAIAGNGRPGDMEATLASIARQWQSPLAGVRVIGEAGDWACISGDWVVVVRPGDRLVPHALACLCHAARNSPGKAAFCADYDILCATGERGDPCFRPPPDPWLLKTVYFAEGPWMFSRAACGAAWAGLPADAAGARLVLARSLRHSDIERVPLVLAQCLRRSPDEIRVERIPQMLARKTRISSGLRTAPCVSIIMPSACRSAHVLDCLEKLLRATAYPDFEILLAVSHTDPADRGQAANLRRAGALPHVRVLDLGLGMFNFSAVNNHAARFARGSLLLLMNDDVVPIREDWLVSLVAYVCAENEFQADIVGPRLLYGNGLVQHGGVIMGLANLCEHAFRLRRRWDKGPHGVAALDRQVSAVTAACMLVRRGLFESLGGLDEGFAIALNDVDFCLRACASGSHIVFAPSVELYHYESLSLGRHYEGVRAGLEAKEVGRLRRNWQGVIAADPFYHPSASLEVGREFQPGFPPRQSPLSWIAREPLAPD